MSAYAHQGVADDMEMGEMHVATDVIRLIRTDSIPSFFNDSSSKIDVVLEDGTMLKVPKHSLTSSSACFKRLITDATEVLQLSGCSKDTFTIFLQWTVAGTLSAAVTVTDYGVADMTHDEWESKALELVKIWCFGQKYMITSLQDLVITNLITGLNSRRVSPRLLLAAIQLSPISPRVSVLVEAIMSKALQQNFPYQHFTKDDQEQMEKIAATKGFWPAWDKLTRLNAHDAQRRSGGLLRRDTQDLSSCFSKTRQNAGYQKLAPEYYFAEMEYVRSLEGEVDPIFRDPHAFRAAAIFHNHNMPPGDASIAYAKQISEEIMHARHEEENKDHYAAVEDASSTLAIAPPLPQMEYLGEEGSSKESDEQDKEYQDFWTADGEGGEEDAHDGDGDDPATEARKNTEPHVKPKTDAIASIFRVNDPKVKVLLVDDTEYEVSRRLLCDASYYFVAALDPKSNFTEAREGRLTLPGTDGPTFECLLHFLCSEKRSLPSSIFPAQHPLLAAPQVGFGNDWVSALESRRRPNLNFRVAGEGEKKTAPTEESIAAELDEAAKRREVQVQLVKLWILADMLCIKTLQQLAARNLEYVVMGEEVHAKALYLAVAQTSPTSSLVEMILRIETGTYRRKPVEIHPHDQQHEEYLDKLGELPGYVTHRFLVAKDQFMNRGRRPQ